MGLFKPLDISGSDLGGAPASLEYGSAYIVINERRLDLAVFLADLGFEDEYLNGPVVSVLGTVTRGTLL